MCVLMRINKLRVREGQANRRRRDYITTNTQKEKREARIKDIRNNNSTAVLLFMLIAKRVFYLVNVALEKSDSITINISPM